jgi:hypothetical protein
MQKLVFRLQRLFQITTISVGSPALKRLKGKIDSLPELE